MYCWCTKKCWKHHGMVLKPGFYNGKDHLPQLVISRDFWTQKPTYHGVTPEDQSVPIHGTKAIVGWRRFDGVIFCCYNMERNGKIHEHGMRHIFLISFSLICMNMFIQFAFIYIYNVNKVRCSLLTNWNKTLLFFFVLVHMDLVPGPSSF